MPDPIFDNAEFDPNIFGTTGRRPTNLTWLKCPQCGEVVDLTRLGPVGKIVKGKLNKAQLAYYMKVLHSRRVRCGFCGLVFKTSDSTIWETFGADSVGDY